jgi:hypothetical protein
VLYPDTVSLQWPTIHINRRHHPVVVQMLLSNKQMPTVMVVLISVNSVDFSHKTSVVLAVLVVLAMVLVPATAVALATVLMLASVLVLVLVSVLVVQAMNHPHTNHQAVVSVAVLVMVHHSVAVLPVVQAVTNHHHSQAVVDMVLMLVSLPEEPSVEDQAINNQALKYNSMLLMLKDSFKIQTHKSSVAQLLVVYKLIHKTSEFAFFNHPQYHHQAHSSSKKFAHLNHPHHPLFVSVNKLPLFLNHPHSFFVKDHHKSQPQLLHKQSSVVWLLYQFHHDRLSSNVFHPFHHDHVMSSSNDGSHMVLKLNDAPLFNVLLPLNNTKVHVTLSSNTKPLKSALFVNSNVLVLLKLTHKHTFNNMVLNSLMPLHFFNKPALLVLSKIFHHQLVPHQLVSVLAHTVKKLHLVHHQASKVVPDSLLEVLLVWMLVMVVVVHHHSNHQAFHQVVVLMPVSLLVV